MENKQTAVEWLFDQINDALIDFTEGKISASMYGIRVTEYKNKAKQMEAEQLNQACYDGYYTEELYDTRNYYKDTYGK